MSQKDLKWRYTLQVLKNLDDEALMKEYLAGNPLAFELIYSRYSAKILAFLRKKLTTREDQDEVFQLVFLKFHRSRKSYDPKYPLLQWLYVITRSTYLDYLKSSKRRGHAIANYRLNSEISDLSKKRPDEPAALENSELLKDLNPSQREVVQQRVFDEASYQEIARKLQVTEATVRQTFSRAIKKLKLLQSGSD
jgi:RNA polymerase sigma-70 factor (ECF subfamily)